MALPDMAALWTPSSGSQDPPLEPMGTCLGIHTQEVTVPRTRAPRLEPPHPGVSSSLSTSKQSLSTAWRWATNMEGKQALPAVKLPHRQHCDLVSSELHQCPRSVQKAWTTSFWVCNHLSYLIYGLSP